MLAARDVIDSETGDREVPRSSTEVPVPAQVATHLWFLSQELAGHQDWRIFCLAKRLAYFLFGEGNAFSEKSHQTS